jgi:hypothetical protein
LDSEGRVVIVGLAATADSPGEETYHDAAVVRMLPDAQQAVGIANLNTVEGDQAAIVDLRQAFGAATDDESVGIQVEVNPVGVETEVAWPVVTSVNMAQKTLAIKGTGAATAAVSVKLIRGAILLRTETFYVNVMPLHPWTNRLNVFDVDGDHLVSALDVLILINELNRVQSASLPALRPDDSLWMDPSSDDQLTPLDVLVVINELNRRSRAGLAAQGLTAEINSSVETSVARGPSSSVSRTELRSATDALFASLDDTADGDTAERSGQAQDCNNQAAESGHWPVTRRRMPSTRNADDSQQTLITA